MKLIHFVVVRNDLPLGTLAAMAVHAAGESGALYEDYSSPMAIGALVIYPSYFKGATAVVLAVHNEAELYVIATKLYEAGVAYVRVVESGGPYDNQFMAIGVVPIERDKLGGLLDNLRLLTTCDPTPLPLPAAIDNGPQSE